MNCAQSGRCLTEEEKDNTIGNNDNDNSNKDSAIVIARETEDLRRLTVLKELTTTCERIIHLKADLQRRCR